MQSGTVRTNVEKRCSSRFVYYSGWVVDTKLLGSEQECRIMSNSVVKKPVSAEGFVRLQRGQSWHGMYLVAG